MKNISSGFILIYMFLAMVVLVLSSSMVFAQPQCTGAFSPFETCNSGVEKYDHVYYAEIESIEPSKHRIVDGVGTFRKIVLNVKREFRGESKRRIVLYASSFLYCHRLEKGDLRIFYAIKVKDDGIKGEGVHFSDRASVMMNSYSKQILSAAFAAVRVALTEQKPSGIEGLVIKTIEKSNKKGETCKGRHVTEEDSPSPLVVVEGVILEATSRQTGAVYRVTSDQNGHFSFDEVSDGTYDVRFKDQRTGEWIVLKEFYVFEESRCSRTWVVQLPTKIGS
ncbi:MAG: carboxypeptidase-like regulatory domain-containing protein [Pyrinomonadaceae bacterium]